MAAKIQQKTTTVSTPKQTGNKYYRLILLMVPLLLYAQTIGFKFVYHDDDTILILGSKVLANFNLHDLFFTDAWLRVKAIELYRPWQSFTYAIDYAIGGPNPWIYHLHNLLGFCLGIQLLYVFLLKLNLPARHAFWLSLIYSVHFLLAHTVCWIPARGDIYLAIFSLGSIICWMSFCESGKSLHLVFTIILYLLALLAKESAATLPVLFVLLYFIYKKPNTGISKPVMAIGLIPMALVLGIYLWMRGESVVAQQGFISVGALVYNLPVVPEEVFKFFVPFYFSVLPAFNPVLTFGGIILIVIIGAAAFAMRGKINQKLFITGVLIFGTSPLAALFYKPLFVGFAYDYLDHRMFFPAVGLLLIVYTLARLHFEKVKVPHAPAALAVVMAVFAFVNAQNYKDKYAYYDNAIKNNPKSGLAWVNYGGLLYADGRYDEAIDKYNHIVALYPDTPDFGMRLADAYLSKKDTTGWANRCREVINRTPGYIPAYFKVAGYYNLRNFTDSLVQVLGALIQHDSTNAVAYFERGTAYFAKAHLLPQAVADYQKSIALNPAVPEPYFQLGNVYVALADYQNAYLNFKKYVELKPADGVGYFYRGQALFRLNRKDEGCKDLQTAAEMGIVRAAEIRAQICR